MMRSLVIMFLAQPQNNLSATIERHWRSKFVFIYLGIRSLQVQNLAAVYDFALQRPLIVRVV